MFDDALSRAAGPEIESADQHYLERDWGEALARYLDGERRDPE
jgi:hypothetical protein